MPRVLITVAATLDQKSSDEGGETLDQENVPPPPSPPSPAPMDEIQDKLESCEPPTTCCVESETTWSDATPAVTATKKTKKIKKKKK